MSDVLQHFQYLHTIPEPGMKEFKTSDYVASVLSREGYRIIRNLGGSTGTAGIWDSGIPGPVLGIRADMDALAHVIDGKTVYRHSCGHDGHMAMLLAAAGIAGRKNLVRKGKLKLIFQPAEETGVGALSVLDSGIIDDMDILTGMHIRPKQECRAGQVIAAMHYSATCILVASIQGVPSHGGRPHLGINPIDAAAAAIVAVNAIHMDPQIPYSVKCTQIHGDGGAFNAIPEFAKLTFDLRAQTNAVMKELKEKVLRALTSAAASVGARFIGAEYPVGDPAGDCISPDVTRLLKECAEETVGAENVIGAINTSGGEDFFHYGVERPHTKIGFLGLGVGAEPGLHHPDMHFDPKYLENGVAIHVKTIQKVLGE